METTEKKFKDICKKNKYYCKKLLTHTSTGHGGNQEADFMVASMNKVYFVECKECLKSDVFYFDRFTQKRKLQAVTKQTSAITPLLLIHFVKHKLIVFLTLEDFENLVSTSKFQNGKQRESFNLKQIDHKYIYTWRTFFNKIP